MEVAAVTTTRFATDVDDEADADADADAEDEYVEVQIKAEDGGCGGEEVWMIE